ncbi:nucleotidyltransferase AbiEii toxin of type IV toxin-antitoxin system [Mucilaginibacter frigoritolerans]|jgi:predicted nucleotidyltransferase component of viral defense system|uniref:Nucleotidyltransferase AbiEii toxin of type IV toxin-antitoxin system n=1 Tax=Mucilaginibacter frigoritolerans TaxID=652788 RepID=A0A562TMB1_9SPHI|nr:nucleotidyl transferase AbiEii/AbiGii toxin family protein [Mucilaginibacter frigoritolerans]TWI94206.1 nucleotidyltransferase AbiEii toxin of type IV toxin-antitoxin system [Mucilaginibacter frigoritolerans]
MLYWNTVNSLLKDCLLTLMDAEELIDFRLVGGTALSLHLGHRMSVDIDLFTDAEYGSIDFNTIEGLLKKSFGYVEGEFGVNPGMGKSYLIGTDPDNVIKLDLYYSMDPFFQEALYKDGIRMATVEEIIAMKVDVVQRLGRKKDFWDLHELLNQYTITTMIALHKQRFQWTHDELLIQNNFTYFSEADDDLDPICLKNKEWIFIKEDIEAAVANR